MADDLTVKIVGSAAEDLPVRVDLSLTSVLALKKLIEQQDAQRFPVSAQRLIFQGQILQDDKLLTEYHVTAGCALHLTLSRVTSTNMAPPTQLQMYLHEMKDCEPQATYATAVRTLHKICVNIVDHPTDEKFRKLRVDNAALKAKLLDRPRGQDCIMLLGFQTGVEAGHVVLVPSPEKWDNVIACKSVVDAEVAALGGVAPTGGSGNVAAQTPNWLPNPSMVQSLSGNPMVQQLSQQNPLLAQALQHPALLAQAMQALQQNPATLGQLNQRLSDPNAIARMEQMLAARWMEEGAGPGGMGSSLHGGAASSSVANPFATSSRPSNPFASSPPTPASTHVSRPNASASPLNATTATSEVDASPETFQEDAIAAAIARSLQDQ